MLSRLYALEKERQKKAEQGKAIPGATSSIESPSGRDLRFNARQIKLFISYSHRDERYLEQLEIRLALLLREGVIAVWHDLKITPGEEWRSAIGNNLDEADCVLLLVTPDFLASDYCYSVEMQQALERHRAGRIIVIPVIVRPTDWEHTPLRELQALPRGVKPIVEWAVREVTSRSGCK